jgi:proteasome accessory factor A
MSAPGAKIALGPYNARVRRLLGIETEYGLHVEGRGAADQVAESAEVVKSLPGPCVAGWDYRFENPRRDARGFTAEHLRYDPVDAQYDAVRPAGDAESADRVLANGARLYNDHGHPEYSTPECLSLMDLVAHDKAGERVVQACAEAYAQRTGRAAKLYKNNTDFQGASYGTHENYLALRSVPFEAYAEALAPFLATRIIFAGAGKVGARQGEPVYQLAQRADVFAELVGIDTLYRRPLINTRDEPHADPAKWRRIHVIAGDANMHQYATALKVGTTSLVLDLVESGWSPVIRLKDPVRAIAAISADDTYRWLAERDAGGTIGAIEVQRQFLSEAGTRFKGRDAQTDWVLAEWAATLYGLETDPMTLADRLDWPAKLQVLRLFMDAEGIEWGSDRLVSADLEYHNVCPEEGLFGALEAHELVSEERIAEAVAKPPHDTRAAIRGLIVARCAADVESISWASAVLRSEKGPTAVDLREYIGEPLDELLGELAAARSVVELVRALDRGPK